MLPKRILKSQYFLYFGVMGIILPYFNLYCHHLGFSSYQIGAISAVRSVVLILLPVFWGFLADRYSARRPIYIMCNIAATLAWVGFLFTKEYTPILILSAVYGVFYAPIISFLEAFTLDVLGPKKTEYGRIRYWGSASFIGVTLVIGKLVDIWSLNIIIFLVLAGGVLQSMSAAFLPIGTTDVKPVFVSSLRKYLHWEVFLFLTCAFLMLASHGAYYGFFSIYLAQLGYGNLFIGVAWAVATAAEILVMICSGRLFGRFSVQIVLTSTFFIAFIRWSLLSISVSPLMIIGTQILHAATYGAFHIASLLYMDSLAPDDAKTVGQALNNAVTYGLGLMVGMYVSGWFYDTLGAANVFMLSGGTALAGGILFFSFRKYWPDPENPPGKRSKA